MKDEKETQNQEGLPNVNLAETSDLERCFIELKNLWRKIKCCHLMVDRKAICEYFDEIGVSELAAKLRQL